MPGSVVHFALYGAEPDRLIRFYGEVFGWRFEPGGFPGFWNIRTPGSSGATFGALTQRDSDPEPGTPNAFRCTIAVDDLESTHVAIVAAGGTQVTPPFDIPGVGQVSEYLDPASNRFCAMKYVAGHPLAE